MSRTQINAALIPTTQYLSKYRRPVLQWNSVSTINIEDQIVTGVTGDCTILFSDGKLITVNNTTQTRFDITRNAVLSGSKQSGLRTGSETNNTWYALYAVRATDNDDTWVTVGDTVFPYNSNITTLNSNFGTDKWIYLGLIPNGDGAGQPGDIPEFIMSGNRVEVDHPLTTANLNGAGRAKYGIRMATTAGASILNWAFSQGGSLPTQIPGNIDMIHWQAVCASGASQMLFGNGAIVASSNDRIFFTLATIGGVEEAMKCWLNARNGAGMNNASGASTAMSLILSGWIDHALGVGSNPLV